jgi:hypothetical protein
MSRQETGEIPASRATGLGALTSQVRSRGVGPTAAARSSLRSGVRQLDRDSAARRDVHVALSRFGAGVMHLVLPAKRRPRRAEPPLAVDLMTKSAVTGATYDIDGDSATRRGLERERDTSCVASKCVETKEGPHAVDRETGESLPRRRDRLDCRLPHPSPLTGVPGEARMAGTGRLAMGVWQPTSQRHPRRATVVEIRQVCLRREKQAPQFDRRGG